MTDMNEDRKKSIIELVVFSISNAVIHYRDKWYRMLEGIPTGGSDSVCLANIYTKWVLIKFFQTADFNSTKKSIIAQFRFIDDLIGGGQVLLDNLCNLLQISMSSVSHMASILTNISLETQ